jgi:ABC-type phosphate/phosphonate transport system substrate-binding protein
MKNQAAPTGPAGARFAPSRREALALLVAGSAAARAQDRSGAFNLALSESVVGDVNLNDARAAMTVWINRLTKELGLSVRIAPEIFEKAEAFPARLRAGSLDAVAVNILEYRRMSTLLDDRQVTVPVQARRLEYVLLVNSNAGIASVADLKGRSLTLLESPPACMAPAWLWTLVHGLEPAGPSRFFGSITREPRPAKVMLPVFFGQVEACVTTSESFATMSELNPQMGKRMKSLAVSPEIVASLYGFRKGWIDGTRERMMSAWQNIGNTASGRQVLTMFQINGLATKDIVCLKATLAILTQAERAGYKPGLPGGDGTAR